MMTTNVKMTTTLMMNTHDYVDADGYYNDGNDGVDNVDDGNCGDDISGYP